MTSARRKSPRPTVEKAKAVVKKYTDLIDGLDQLGVTATIAQVEPLLKELFPTGTDGVAQGEVIRAVFLRLRRQNPTDNLGR